MFACVCRTLRPLGIPVAFFCLPSLSLGRDHPGTLVLVTLDDALMDVRERERVQGLTAMWKSEHSATLRASVPGMVGSCLFLHLFLPVNEPVPHVPSPTFQGARGLDSCVGTIFISSCASPGSECFSRSRRFPSGRKKRPDCVSEVVDAAAADGVDRCRTITRQMDVLSFTWPLRVNASLSYLQGMMGNDSSEDGGTPEFLRDPSSPRLSLPLPLIHAWSTHD